MWQSRSVGFHNQVYHCYYGQSGFTSMSIIVTVVTVRSLLWSQFGCYCGHNLVIIVDTIWPLLWSQFGHYCGRTSVVTVVTTAWVTSEASEPCLSFLLWS